MSVSPVELGRNGVWLTSGTLTDVSGDQLGEFAAAVEQAGYGALWIGNDRAALPRAEAVLAATEHLAYATGILNIWTESSAESVASYHRVNAAHPNRLLLGIGIGHREAVSGYTKPYDALVAYLERVAEVPREHLALAALGPKVLRLSAARTAGAHPYLVTPEYTRTAREILGPDALLAPDQKVVLSADPTEARGIARDRLRPYLGLVNYRNNLLRLGYTEDDLAGPGSDRLVDALIAWGDVDTVAKRVRAHHEAGADHVCVQVLGGSTPLPTAELTALAAALN